MALNLLTTSAVIFPFDYSVCGTDRYFTPYFCHRYRLQKLISNRQQDKQNLAILDRRVQEERKQKTTLEQQLMAEKRRKTDDSSRKADDSSRAAVAVASSSR